MVKNVFAGRQNRLCHELLLPLIYTGFSELKSITPKGMLSVGSSTNSRITRPLLPRLQILAPRMISGEPPYCLPTHKAGPASPTTPTAANCSSGLMAIILRNLYHFFNVGCSVFQLGKYKV